MNGLAMQALLDVLAATPEPPDAQTDPSDVIDLAQQMTETREESLALLQQVMANNGAVEGEGQAVLAEINDRDARWQAALGRARHELTQRMQAARHIRRRIPSAVP
jgi:hypothetical protein